MAQRYHVPFPQHFDGTPSAYSGGKLYFYASGTSTPLDTYSNEGLSVVNTNPVILNSAGRPDVDIFLQNLAYKVVLKDASDNTIWTADPVYSTDFKSVPILKVSAGNPNGSVAGTAASSGVLPTVCWDYTNNLWYVCTTTGTASTAVWTSINTAASSQPNPPPQGYLTLTSDTPIITGDVTAATSVYYTPFVGNLCPLYNGSTLVPTTFSELTLSLVASHALNTIYDVFLFSDSGTLRIGTGPAWSSSTAGSSSRGSGAGTTQLTRLNGIWVNAQSMTVRNGSSTYTVAGNYGTYLGSIYIDGTAGQVSCHRTYGQSRKWGVWNAYNRQQLHLKVGDGTSSWTYTTNTWRQSRANTANTLTVFAGLAETAFEIVAEQMIQAQTNTTSTGAEGRVGIGWNSTTAASGREAWVGGEIGTNAVYVRGNGIARHVQAPALGVNAVNMIERASATAGTVTFYGTEPGMLMEAKWWG